MKHSEDNNRDATLGGDEDRSNFITINNLRIRARLARDGSSGEGTVSYTHLTLPTINWV